LSEITLRAHGIAMFVTLNNTRARAHTRPPKKKGFIYNVYVYSPSYKKIEIMCVYVCLLIAQERINRFVPISACLFLETRKIIQKDKNSKKLSKVKVPVRVVPPPFLEISCDAILSSVVSFLGQNGGTS
jgi:hypothetical protein